MKFKRYIREADMSLRDKINQEMNNYGKFKSIKNRIKDVLETYEKASSKVKLYDKIDKDGSTDLVFPEDILSPYYLYIDDNGENIVFGVNGKEAIPLFFLDADDVEEVADTYGGDDSDREDSLNAFYMFVNNFDKIENWFYRETIRRLIK